jgi:hypothetical protein
MKNFALVSFLVTLFVCSVHSGGDPYAICDEPKDVGFTCGSAPPQTLFYYDGLTGFCEPLEYLGCGGNGNRFSDQT